MTGGEGGVEGRTAGVTEGRTLWHGRFEEGPSDALMAFSVSLDIDIRLAPHDIEGSKAHVRGLRRSGLLTGEEASTILDGLDDVGEELAAGTFAFMPGDEDIHTAIERRVTELAGPVGGKVHTGRSRNDQVATAFRLWTKEALAGVVARVTEFREMLAGRAAEVGDAYLPGYTHLQRAQPVPLAHHLAAHAWALGRDVDRLSDALDRMDVSPLGAGALAGSSLPLDPVGNAADLGFAAPFQNSLDVTSDRDFAAEALFGLALLGVHLSRIGEEMVLWASSEFGFVGLHDSWSTGSSMMPQKKNPDIAELTRGKTGRLVGNLTALMVTLKGLPLAYNRDLQEDKAPLMDSVEQIELTLAALHGMVATATFRTDAMAAAADDQAALATDLAEILVASGLPFRDAHARVGELVRRSLAGEGALSDLVAADPAFVGDGESPSPAAGLFEPGAAVARRNSLGGAGLAPVARQLEQLAASIGADRQWLADYRTGRADAAEARA